jgi:hypothetical protein
MYSLVCQRRETTVNPPTPDHAGHLVRSLDLNAYIGACVCNGVRVHCTLMCSQSDSVFGGYETFQMPFPSFIIRHLISRLARHLAKRVRASALRGQVIMTKDLLVAMYGVVLLGGVDE